MKDEKRASFAMPPCVMRARKQTAKCNTGPPVDSVGQESGSSPEGLARRALALCERIGGGQKTFFLRGRFFLRAVTGLVSFRCALRSLSGETRRQSPRRRQ